MPTRTSPRIPAWITISVALLVQRASAQYASADARLASSTPLAQAYLGRDVPTVHRERLAKKDRTHVLRAT